MENKKDNYLTRYTDSDNLTVSEMTPLSLYIYGRGGDRVVGEGPVMDVDTVENLRDTLTKWLESRPREVTVSLSQVHDGESFTLFGRNWKRDKSALQLPDDVIPVVACDDGSVYMQYLCGHETVTVVR